MNRRRRKKVQRALMEAIALEDGRRVGALLRARADPNTPGRDGLTPLYMASVSNLAQIARNLLTAGADPNVESTGPGQDDLPLCAAACWGHDAVVAELLAHGADPDLREDRGEGMTALQWAENNGHPFTATLLRTRKPPQNAEKP